MFNVSATHTNHESTHRKAAIIKRSAMKPIFILVVFLFAIGFQVLIPPQTAKADVVAGFSEYYIPGGAEQVLAILKNNNTLTDNSSFAIM